VSAEPDGPGGSPRTLFLLRHAKSSWDHPVGDHDRPLSGRGVRDARALGRLIAERGWWPDLVLCSSALRARQTWQQAAAAGAGAREVRFTERVYAAMADELLDLIREAPDELRSLMIIGHGPGLPALADQLCGPLNRKYATSGLAVLRVGQPWSALDRADLMAFELPRG
jgi:phosphohistidine phosphatase